MDGSKGRREWGIEDRRDKLYTMKMLAAIFQTKVFIFKVLTKIASHFYWRIT